MCVLGWDSLVLYANGGETSCQHSPLQRTFQRRKARSQRARSQKDTFTKCMFWACTTWPRYIMTAHVGGMNEMICINCNGERWQQKVLRIDLHSVTEEASSTKPTVQCVWLWWFLTKSMVLMLLPQIFEQLVAIVGNLGWLSTPVYE